MNSLLEKLKKKKKLQQMESIVKSQNRENSSPVIGDLDFQDKVKFKAMQLEHQTKDFVNTAKNFGLGVKNSLEGALNNIETTSNRLFPEYNYINQKNVALNNKLKEKDNLIKNNSNIKMNSKDLFTDKLKRDHRYGKGNIDLLNRPKVKNDDGSISTVESISFYDEKINKEVLIPKVVNGKVVSAEEAKKHYFKTGEYLGKFNTPEEATEYAINLHNEQVLLYTRNPLLNKTLNDSPVNQYFNEKINENQVKIQENIDDTTNKVMKKVNELMPSIAQSATGAVLSEVNPALGLGFFHNSAADSYYKEAKNRGMTDDEAFKFANIMGAAESVSEYIGGELSKNVGKLAFKGKAKSALQTYGLDILENFVEEAGIEPVQEIVADIIGDYGNWDEMSDRIVQSGIDGALTSLLMGGASFGIGESTKIIDDLSQNKKVNSQEVKNTLNEILKSDKVDSKKIINDNFNYAANEILNQQNGKIPSEINADKFANINQEKQANTMQNKDFLNQGQQTIQTEGKMPKKSIYEQIEEMPEIEQNLQENMQNNEDISLKYDIKYNNFKDSMKKYNLSDNDKTFDNIFKVAKTSNNELLFDDTIFKDEQGNDIEADALYLDGKIYLNPKAKDSTKTLENLVVHEAIHSKANTKEYQALKKSLIDFMKSKNEYEGARADLENLYSKVYDKTEKGFNDKIDEEVIANSLGEKFGNDEFIRYLTQNNDKTVLQKIVDWFKDIVNKLSGYKDQQQFYKSIQEKLEKTLKSDGIALDGKRESALADIKDYGIKEILKTRDSNLRLLDKLQKEGNDAWIDLANIVAEMDDYIDDFDKKNKTTYKQVAELIFNGDQHSFSKKGNKELLYSLKNQKNNKDNKGRELSKEQQEYFKNSKVRDDKGNLLEVYHGTPSKDFNVFEKNNGIFFSTNEKFAKNYGEEKSFDEELDADITVKKAYLNIEKLFDGTNEQNIEEIKDELPDKLIYGQTKLSKNEFLDFLKRKETLKPVVDKNKAEKLKFGESLSNIYNKKKDLIENGKFIGINDDNIVYVNTQNEEGLKNLTLSEQEEMKKALFNGDTYTTPRLYQTQYGLMSKDAMRERIKYLEKNPDNYSDYSIQTLKDIINGDMFPRPKTSEFKYYPNITSLNEEQLTDVDNWNYIEEVEFEKNGERISFLDFIKNKGFDGIKVFEKGIENYAAFEPNQIKNIDNIKPTNNPDIRYSLRDNKGKKLSKEQQEYFKNVSEDLKDENGNLITYYNGSGDFTVYDPSKLQGSSKWGKGIYLTKYKDIAKNYGDNIKEVYLKVEDPIQIDKKTITFEEYSNLYKDIFDEEAYKEEYDMYNNDLDLLWDMTDNGKWTEYADKIKKYTNKDGLIIKSDNKTDDMAIVFKSNQIKNTNNLNPTKNPDIRYSLKDSSNNQRNFFKDSKVLDKDNKNLQEVYHTTTGTIPQFNIFDPRQNSTYKFGNQVVNYFTNSKEMSGSYANQSYKTANTGKINNIEDLNKKLDKINNDYNLGFELNKKGNKLVLKETKNISNNLINDELEKLKKVDISLYNSFVNNIRWSLLTNESVDSLLDTYVDRKDLNSVFKKIDKILKQNKLSDSSESSINKVLYALNEKNDKEITFNSQEDLFKNFDSKMQEIIPELQNKWQYNGFLNIRNPYVIDAKGSNWNNISANIKEEAKENLNVINNLSKEEKDNLLNKFNKEIKNKEKADQNVKQNNEAAEKLLKEDLKTYNEYVALKEVLKNSNYKHLYKEYPDEKFSSKYESNNLFSYLPFLEAKGYEYDSNMPLSDTLNKMRNDLMEVGGTDFIDKEANKEIIINGEKTTPFKFASKSFFDNEDSSISKQQIIDKLLQNELSHENYEKLKKSYGTISLIESQLENNFEINDSTNLANKIFNELNAEKKETNDIVNDVLKFNRNLLNKNDNENITPEEILKNGGYDGVIIKNVVDYGGVGLEEVKPSDVYVTFGSNQFKAKDNMNPTNDPDIRYSFTDENQWNQFINKYFKNKGTGKTLAETQISESDKIGKSTKTSSKAEKYQARQENIFKNDIVKKLEVSKYINKDILNDSILRLENEFKANNDISKETADEVFNDLYKNLIKEDTRMYDEYKGLKKNLRETKLYVPREVKADIPDYGSFRSRNLGNLTLTSKTDNINIDTYYKELSSEYPDLFPAEVSNPSDQLLIMADVGKDISKVDTNIEAYNDETLGKEYKKYAKRDFDIALDQFKAQLKIIDKFRESKNDIQAKMFGEESIENVDLEEIKGLYEARNELEKEYQKVSNKELLTKREQGIVKRLLDGEMGLEEILPGFNKEGIEKVYNAKIQLDAVQKGIKEYKTLRKEQLNEINEELLSNVDSFKDKSKGIFYKRETATRNIKDIMQKEDAERVNKAIFEPVQKNEADRIRYINKELQKVKDLNIDTNKTYNYGTEKINEADIAGLYLEKKIDEAYIVNNGIELSRIQEIANTFKGILDNAVNRMEEEYLKNGYAPVQRRKNYFPHFTENKPDTLLQKITKGLGIDTTNQELPTQIAGLTDTFKPGRTWNRNILQRKTDISDINALKVMEMYVNGASDVIYHTEDIQKLRSFENAIRDRYADIETQKRIDNITNNEELTEVEKADAIQKIHDQINTPLPNFVTWLNEYTNTLANKKSKADRSFEDSFGRQTYKTMADIEGKIASNMIGGNVGVSLTNIAPIAQAMGTTKIGNVLNGMIETTINDINEISGKGGDDLVSRSNFLTRRRGTETIQPKKITEKISDTISKPMEIIDNFASESIVRAKYQENLQKGMDEIKALDEADKYARDLMADRSKGAVPVLFNQKNPLSKALTMFQVEPNNIISNYTKDMKTEKNKIAAYGKLAAASYAFNTVLKSIRGGSNILPDPISIVSSLMKMITSDDDEEKEKAKDKVITDILGSLPFGSSIGIVAETLGIDIEGLEDMGRIPVASAIPSIKKLQSIKGEEVSPEYKKQVLEKELMKPLLFLGLPTGGAQINKTIQGLKALQEGGSYKYDKKTGNKLLQFPIEQTPSNAIKSSLFGKYATPEGQKYIESFKSLNAKQTKLYEDSKIDFNDLQEYFDYSKKEDSKDKKIEYINKLDITDKQKYDLYKYNILTESQTKSADYVLKNKMTTEKGLINQIKKTKENNIEYPDIETLDKIKNADLKIDTYLDYKAKEKAASENKKAEYEAKAKTMLPESKEKIEISKTLNNKDKVNLLSGFSNKDQKNIYKTFIDKEDETFEILNQLEDLNMEGYTDYLKQDIKSLKNPKTGKTIPNSRKNNLIQYLNSNDKLTPLDRVVIYGKYYKLSSDEQKIITDAANKAKLNISYKK